MNTSCLVKIELVYCLMVMIHMSCEINLQVLLDRIEKLEEEVALLKTKPDKKITSLPAISNFETYEQAIIKWQDPSSISWEVDVYDQLLLFGRAKSTNICCLVNRTLYINDSGLWKKMDMTVCHKIATCVQGKILKRFKNQELLAEHTDSYLQSFLRVLKFKLTSYQCNRLIKVYKDLIA